MEYLQYADFIKPDWAPPSWLFGPVWTVLYAGIIATFGYTLYLVWKKQLPQKVASPFVFNIVFNLLFTPIQFGLKNNILAAVDIVLVLLTLIWAMRIIHKYKPWIAYAQIPYLLWVSFATVLQFTITYLNL